MNEHSILGKAGGEQGPARFLPSKRTMKAVVAAVVSLAAYFVGVFPEDAGLVEGFAQLTGLQWLGAVVFLGGAYGLTYRVPNRPRH